MVFLTLLALCLGIVGASSVSGQDLQQLEQEAVRSATESVADSVVQIETLGGLESVDGMLTSSAPTTGLVVDSEGWIVSSAINFIQQPASILVTLPGGEKKPATIVARDRSRMLVLLKVQPDKPLPVPVAVPRDQLQVGQTAIAIGRTFDPSQVNLSVGIVSAIQRIWGKAVQTDANISPANYGGPLIDLYGRVIGVLVPLSPESDSEVAGNEWYDSGIGFAVPLTDILARLETLKTGKDLKAGLLGFAFENSQKLDAPPVLGVVKTKSPAAQAGLKAGDRLVSLNNVPIELQSDAMHVLKPLYAGDEIQYVAKRGDETLQGQAILVDQLIPFEHAYLGIAPSRVTASETKKSDETNNEAAADSDDASNEDAKPEQPAGVTIRHVFADTPASQAGLQAGDRLNAWNGSPVANSEQLRAMLANHDPGEKVTIGWLRGEEPKTAEVTLDRLPRTLADLDTLTVEAAPAAPPQAGAATGQLEWKVPEEPNRGAGYVPANYSADQSWGLLALIGPPSDEDFAKIIEPWKAICDEHRLILIVPQPEDPERWTPTEVAFVRKAIDQAIRVYNVDPQRVAAMGQEGGGGMAFLLAFRHRDLIRGLVIDRAAIPFGLMIPDNEPLQRLSLLIHETEDAKLKERVEQCIEALTERKFPVVRVKRSASDGDLTNDERHQLARWIDTLDRL